MPEPSPTYSSDFCFCTTHDWVMRPDCLLGQRANTRVSRKASSSYLGERGQPGQELLRDGRQLGGGGEGPGLAGEPHSRVRNTAQGKG